MSVAVTLATHPLLRKMKLNQGKSEHYNGKSLLFSLKPLKNREETFQEANEDLETRENKLMEMDE